MGFLEALVAVLMVLKLTGVIAVSWWIVFAPLALYVIPLIIWLAFTAIAFARH